jgi:endonuclease/exonuclease/phosphatase family metal-dependent hydrolase
MVAEVLPEDRELARRAVSSRSGLIDGHLARLRALPAHGNRGLHMDQLFLGLLLDKDGDRKANHPSSASPCPKRQNPGRLWRDGRATGCVETEHTGAISFLTFKVAAMESSATSHSLDERTASSLTEVGNESAVPPAAAPAPRRRRGWRGFLALVILGAIALALVGNMRSSTGPASGQGTFGSLPSLPAGKIVFRIGTFNMHSGIGEDDVYNLNRTIEAVRDTDFCALNEVRGRFSGVPRNQAEELAQATHRAWLYLPSERRFWHEDFGNGLITRLPIREWVRTPLPIKPSHGGLRNATIARVELGNREVQILLTHIDRSRDQANQIQMVSRLFDALAEPSMLVGDLNADSENPEVKNLLHRAGIHDCITEGTGRAGGRIDWILARGVKTVAGGQIQNGASDHPLYWVDVSPNP